MQDDGQSRTFSPTETLTAKRAPWTSQWRILSGDPSPPLEGEKIQKSGFQTDGNQCSFSRSGGTTDSDHSRAQLPPAVANQPSSEKQLVSKMAACRPPPRAPAPTASKEKVVKKEEAVVGNKEVVVEEEEEEEKEEEKLPPAMNAMDPGKRLDRLVSFLKL